jgi:hypothetical protein
MVREGMANDGQCIDTDVMAPDARTPTKVVGVLDIGDAGVWGWN